MSKVSSRPFVPCGDFEHKTRADNVCVTLNKENPGQKWVRCLSPKGDGRFAIIRKK